MNQEPRDTMYGIKSLTLNPHQMSDGTHTLELHWRIANALERIADALEQKNTMDDLSTEFFKKLSEAPSTPQITMRKFSGYKESTTLDHYLVLVGGVWLDATDEEDAFILSEINRKQ